MGLLDELKQQAELKRAELARAEAEQEARHAAYRENILPRMRRLFSYLSELAEHLNYVDAPVSVSYPIKTYDTLRDLRQRDYKVRADSMEGMKRIDFSFECAADGHVQFEVENKLYIERLEEYLTSARLNYVCNKFKDSRHNVTSARFRIDNHVPVSLVFEVDVDKGMIRTEIRNHSGLHVDRFTVDPADIDDDFLEELGKFILRQESRLFRLEISEEERQRIRERLKNGGKAPPERKRGKSGNGFSLGLRRKRRKEAGKAEVPPSPPEPAPAESPADGAPAEASPPPKAAPEPAATPVLETPVERPQEAPAAPARSGSPPPGAERTPESGDSGHAGSPGRAAAPPAGEVPPGPPMPEVPDEPTASQLMAMADRDDDLGGFELQFSTMPAAYKPLESVAELSRGIMERLQELEKLPGQMMRDAAQMLDDLNHTTLDAEERLALAGAVFSRVYPVMMECYASCARDGALLKEGEKEAMLEASVEVAEQVATAYKHAFKSAYTPDARRFEAVASRLSQWGFRILEMIRLEQRLRALKYQKLPRPAWLDANQVFFSLLRHEAIDEPWPLISRIGLVPAGEDAGSTGDHQSSVRRVYLSLQLFGVLDVITWPASLFYFPDAYLDELEEGLRIEQDSGEKLEQGCLITFLLNDGPPLHKRNDAIPAPALRIDFSRLFQRIVREHEDLANMMFINAVDEEKLSPSLAALDAQERIPVLEMMLLALQRRERKHDRHAVFGTEKLWVHFGFAACYTNLSGFVHPDGDDREKSLRYVEMIQQKSIELAERNPPFTAVPWKIINFSTGGLLVANDSPKFNTPLQVGQLVAFRPADNSDLPLMGFIGRIQRPVEHQIEISIIRLAKYAEAALAQDQREARGEDGKPVILVQDFDGRWQLVVLHDYGYTTGTPLKLVRGSGVRILLRLGDIWMTKRDFTVFEVRSASL